MSSKVLIPRDIAGVEKSLGALGKLISAQEWERAAIVAAFVMVTPNGKGLDGHMSAQDFAALGIVGLTTDKTVRHYFEAWTKNVGRERPVPGETVDLTGLPTFQANETVGAPGGMTPERRDALMKAGQDAGMKAGSKVVDIAANPKSMRLAIINDDKTAEEARLALQARDIGARTGIDMGKAMTANPAEGPWSPMWVTTERRVMDAISALSRHASEHPDEAQQVVDTLDAITDYIATRRALIVGVPDDISSLT
jgi:hypothetical protein